MIGLAFGRSVVWSGQSRDAHGVAWSTALTGLWPPFLFGLAVCGALAALSLPTFLWSLPLTFGYLVAVLFAVATACRCSAPARLRLCAIPRNCRRPRSARSAGGT